MYQEKAVTPTLAQKIVTHAGNNLKQLYAFTKTEKLIIQQSAFASLLYAMWNVIKYFISVLKQVFNT